MLFENEDKTKFFHLSQGHIDLMLEEAERADKLGRCETGGMILGNVPQTLEPRDTADTIYISRPDPDQPLEQYGFTRKKPDDDWWKRMTRDMDWLGEWHTHPYNSSEASNIDDDTMMKYFDEFKENEDYWLFLLIIGGSKKEGYKYGLYFYEKEANSKDIVKTLFRQRRA